MDFNFAYDTAADGWLQRNGTGWVVVDAAPAAVAEVAVDHVALLNARLFGPGGMGATNIKIFAGSAPASADAIAREIGRSLDQIERGAFERVA